MRLIVWWFAGPLLAVLIGLLLGGELVSYLGVSPKPSLTILSSQVGLMSFLVLHACVWARSVRGSINQTLANLGQAICPGCGYDMKGHSSHAHVSITCPECGAPLADSA